MRSFQRRADNSTPQPAAAVAEHRSDLDDLSAANVELEAEGTPARTVGGIGSLLANVFGRSRPTFTVARAIRGSPPVHNVP